MSADKRLQMLETMIDKGSTDPFVHYAHAMELRALDRKQEALEAFEAVALRFPDYVPTYLIGGQLAVELGDEDRARSFYERGIDKARAASDGKALGELQNALAEIA